MEFIIHTLEETKQLATKLAKLVKPGMLFTLSGDLGAGKTTFTKFLGQELGIKEVINSPTFMILKSYEAKIPLYHIDAYRLEGIVQDLGFEELFEDDGICIVEWPLYLEYILPSERLEISIQNLVGEERKFDIKAIGKQYEALLEDLQ